MKAVLVSEEDCGGGRWWDVVAVFVEEGGLGEGSDCGIFAVHLEAGIFKMGKSMIIEMFIAYQLLNE